MAKPDQILELTPASELKFEGPFDNVVTSYLHLYNPSTKRVCFKVKTTAPRRYCVRPNSGIVEPLAKVSIAIMLQPFEIDSQNDRNKHKFMVQSVVVGEDEGDVNQESLWKNISNELVMDSKLKCVFHLPNTTTAATSPQAAAAAAAAASSSVYSSSKTHTEVSTELPASTKSQQESTASQQQESTARQQQQQQQHQESVARQQQQEFKASQYQQTTPTVSSTGTTQTRGQLWDSMSSDNEPTEQKATFLIVAFVVLVIGIILGKYII